MYKANLNEYEKKLQRKLAEIYNAENLENDVWFVTIDASDMKNINLDDLENGLVYCSKFGDVTIGTIQISIRDYYLEEEKCLNSFKDHKRLGSIGTFCLILFHGFRWCPTLRTSKNGWDGEKIGFNMVLEERDYTWVVYIKFYITKDNVIKPLVVGKSGSTKVNSSGCDLSFSTAVEDGPARKFLHDKKYEWYQDYILIKNFKDEKAAYAFEGKIMRKYDMYGS